MELFVAARLPPGLGRGQYSDRLCPVGGVGFPSPNSGRRATQDLGLKVPAREAFRALQLFVSKALAVTTDCCLWQTVGYTAAAAESSYGRSFNS